MKSLWNETQASELNGDLLKLRVYTSRLIGQDPSLVLHGGGNTSVKIKEKNLFGEEEDILYVKGSGWDLGTIEAEGFAPVKLDVLTRMAGLDSLSDTDMVKFQRAAMTNPSAPNPSVEAILHAVIPYTFVDHTHADAVVTITNNATGKARIEEIYGDRVLIVPYVMPGFILAKEIYEMTKGMDWESIDGMILLNHGVFTYAHDPKESYEKMIRIVAKAEEYLESQGAVLFNEPISGSAKSRKVAEIRKAVSGVWGKPCLTRFDGSPASLTYSDLPDIEELAVRGPITPDHTIRTKRVPVVLGDDPISDVEKFVQDYTEYFNKYNDGSLTMVDPAPRWAVWPGEGVLRFGRTPKEVGIITDITRHTMKAIRQGEKIGGWKPLEPGVLFELEYWELEQAKLKKGGTPPAMQGKIAVVTGAASGIGKACVESLVAQGAVVAALDINPDIRTTFLQKEVLGIVCDITRKKSVKDALKKTILHFGGIDMLVSNAGIFPRSKSIANMDNRTWKKSMELNLTSHQRLLTICLPFLEMGIDPAVVIIGSKNVPAPGPGASAYSVAKAGLTQLARIAAMEFGKKGIRVNVIHPNAVYDTGIWNDQVLKARADHYGLTVQEYKTNNVLKTEVTSVDVANLATLMLGKAFSKITGAQVPIDGGNDRVI